MNITVLGNGGFGTAMAMAMERCGHSVKVWGHDANYTAAVQETRLNERYLPGVRIPDSIRFSSDASAALEGAEAILVAVPTQHVRSAFAEGGLIAALPPGAALISLSKGLELETTLRPSEVLAEVAEKAAGAHSVLVLSGPSHAEEIARGLPATVVLAGDAATIDAGELRRLQGELSDRSLRIYANDDLLGVELCGALKNVMAIATGIAGGLGLGDNAKAATLARGLVEMRRFGEAAGARAETFVGLAGVGDLAVTAFSAHGRNRAFGERIGRGETLDDILATTHKVAEGVWTSRVVLERARELGVEMPICAAVCSVLFEGVPADRAVHELMERDYKAEM